MVKRTDYLPDDVNAARSVLLEVGHLLGEYRDHIAVVGGWVPELIIPESRGSFVGSMDVDLALDHRALSDPGYKTFQELLSGKGYIKDVPSVP